MPPEASPAAVTSPVERRSLRGVAAAAARSERVHAGALAALIVAALLLFTDLKTAGTAAFADPGWDRHLYIEMARTNPLDFHLAPFGWRVLVPSLAALSPFSLQASFLAVTVFAAWAIGPVLYELFRTARFSHTWALVGEALFYTVGWATKFQLADFWIPDATAFLFVAVGLLLAVRRRPVAFAAVLMVGVLAKESVVVVAPMFYALNARGPRELRLLAVNGAVVVPAAAVLIALRLLIPAYNGDAVYIASLPERISRFPELFPPYNYLSLLREIGYERRYQARDFDTFVSYTSGTFGAALFGTALLTILPAVQFSGLIDPVSTLEGVGALIGQIYPTTHFVTIARGTFSKGLGFMDLRASFVPLLIAVPVLIGLGAALLRKQER